ncbi:MAG: MFS transporter [Candidatus Diapherotrites archaeon]|nr:MFS transporter [Candidatus Diapherotrites archaeon]
MKKKGSAGKDLKAIHARGYNKEADEPKQFESNIPKMYVFYFLKNLQFFTAVIVPFFVDWGGVSFTQIMFLQTLFVFASFILEVPTGAVADRFGRKTSIILGALVGILGALVHSSYPTLSVFVLGEILFAVSHALLSGATEALTYDSLRIIGEETVSKAVFSKIYSFRMAGLMVAAPVGSIIAHYWGLQYTMMLVAVPMLAASVVALTMKEPRIKETSEMTRYWDTLVSGIKYLRHNRTLRALATDDIAVRSIAFYIIWTYQPILQNLGVEVLWFGLVSILITAGQIVVSNIFPQLETLFGSKKNYVKYSAIIPGICFILLAFTTNPLVAAGLVVITASVGLSRTILLANYFNKHIDSRNRATVLSTISMLFMFARAIIAPVLGVLVDWSLSAALIVLGALLIATAALSRVEEHMMPD